MYYNCAAEAWSILCQYIEGANNLMLWPEKKAIASKKEMEIYRSLLSHAYFSSKAGLPDSKEGQALTWHYNTKGEEDIAYQYLMVAIDEAVERISCRQRSYSPSDDWIDILRWAQGEVDPNNPDNPVPN